MMTINLLAVVVFAFLATVKLARNDVAPNFHTDRRPVPAPAAD